MQEGNCIQFGLGYLGLRIFRIDFVYEWHFHIYVLISRIRPTLNARDGRKPLQLHRDALHHI